MGYTSHSALTKAFALSGDSHPLQVTVTGWGWLLTHLIGFFCRDNVTLCIGLAGSFLVLNYPGKFSL